MLIGIERYRFIMEKVQRVDVSLDEGFQKTYENFYTLGRYPKEFPRDYFVYMERVTSFKYVASDDRKALILPYNFCMVYWLGSSFSESGINGRINCVQ